MLAVANILLTLTGIYGDFRGLYEQSDSLEISDFRRFAALQRTTRHKPKRTPKRKAARSNRASAPISLVFAVFPAIDEGLFF